MLTKDIHGKTLSSTFDSKIVSPSQRLKPKVVVNWLESKNITGLSSSVDANNQHVSTDQGDLGYYFSPEQAVNGYERQSFTWAVAGAKDKNGSVIRADGNWFVMPNDLDDDYEFGWWSGSVSTSSVHATYGGYEFANNPTVTFTFDDRACNMIKVFTSEFYGQVHTYRLTVKSNDAGVPDPLYSEVITISEDEYSYSHYLPASVGHETINEVEIEVLSTRNPVDYARVQEVNVMYQTDISNDIISADIDFTRDLHVTELPIAGSGNNTVSLNIDNTDKDYSVFNSSSTYGQYMKKNVSIETALGWQIKKSDSLYIESNLRASLSNSATTISVDNAIEFPDGGSGDEYVMIIDPDNYTREYVLISSKNDTYTLTAAERGYNNSIARSHAAGTKVVFETYEYPTAVKSYVDEWSSATGSMAVSASSTDFNKFASEKVITNGFFMEGVTTADAVQSLMMNVNFPKADIKSLNTFDRSARYKEAILHLNFSESVADRDGTTIPVKNGLRGRFFALPAGRYNKVKDIIADALDRQLSDLEKAMGDIAFTLPDYTFNSADNAYTAGLALDIVDFSFTDANGETISDYYNMVFDGYYVPPDSGDQILAVGIAHGGVRLYLEDTLILDEYVAHPVGIGVYSDLESEIVNLVAGKPYKLRIEAYHTVSTNGNDEFSMYLQYAIGSDPLSSVPAENCYTMAALDRIGSKDAPYTAGSTDRNKTTNDGIYIGEANVNSSGGLTSDPENKSVRFTSDKYMRLPYDLSWDLNNSTSENYTGQWSFELYIKPNSSGFSSDYAYLSSFNDSSTPTAGFEFYNSSTANGFKMITSSGTEYVESSGPLEASAWSHIVVTFDGSDLKYYINGVLEDTLSVVGSIASWNNCDIAFGGRNAYYLIGTGEVSPVSLKDFFCDQFLIYKKTLTASEVGNRYTEAVMQPLATYPFLYGNESSIKDIIEQVTLADLGRFYIDEENKARYEHFYAFFESSIDQHANTQVTIDDDTNIIDASYNVQLQANKVVVKIAGLSSNLVGVQSLWRADSPTTLAVVNLESNLSASANVMTVSSTTDPPFFKAGYLVIDSEIIKYSSKSDNTFGGLERGQFGTDAVSHSANTAVREARYWDLKYDKAPAFEVKDPFITGIRFEYPPEIDILKWNPEAYGAELVISANVNVDKGTFVFAEGTDPVTEKVAFTAVSGTPVLLTEQKSQIKEQSANLSENIRLYGLKEVVIENPFITDFDHGQKIANFIISKMSDPVPVLNLNTLLTPKVMTGDRIKITSLDAFDIINGEYWVTSKRVSYSDSPSQSLMLRKVV